MKSPPADIFIWGVHPSTTPEDIVEDLAYSDIKIQVSDIEKKTRQDGERPSGLDSYKISIKAEDLTKALSADVWPLRIRVREWVHYSNRRSSREGGGGKFGAKGGRVQPQQPQPGEEAGWKTVQHGRGGQQGQQQQEQSQPRMLSTGMFDSFKSPSVATQ